MEWLYTTYGKKRGRCGHKHKSVDEAAACLDEDRARCKSKGKPCDRDIFAINSTGPRPLNAEELKALQIIRCAARQGDD